jgi:hypothetical protein
LPASPAGFTDSLRASAVVSSGGDNPGDELQAPPDLMARLRGAASPAGRGGAQQSFAAARGGSLLGTAFGRTALPPDDPPRPGEGASEGGGRGGEARERGRAPGRGGPAGEGAEGAERGGGGGAGGAPGQGPAGGQGQGQGQEEFNNLAALSKVPLTGVLHLLSTSQAPREEGGEEVERRSGSRQPSRTGS